MATLRVNGRAIELGPDGGRSLLGLLRDELGLTGAKYGCGEGQCGACMVLVDGVATPACRPHLHELTGCEVTTVENLAAGGELHPVQRAFVEVGALQCGFCTPGMIMSAVALLAGNPAPSDDEIRAAMAANVCRCGAYPRIVEAVQRAAAAIRAGRGDR